ESIRTNTVKVEINKAVTIAIIKPPSDSALRSVVKAQGLKNLVEKEMTLRAKLVVEDVLLDLEKVEIVVISILAPLPVARIEDASVDAGVGLTVREHLLTL